MIWSKIASAVVQVLFGDVAGCYKNLRKGLEPFTNSARIFSLFMGGTAGALITILLLPHILNDLLTTINGGPLSNFETLSVNITDGSLGIIIGSRVLDVIISKMMLPLYYYLKYGNSRELYKDFTDKEILLIHDNLAIQPGSSLQTMDELKHSVKYEGYSPEHIKEIQETVRSGTKGLLIGIRAQIIDYKEHVDDQEKINNHMSLLRLGKISHLCLLNDSYVGSIVMERFDIPKLNGRRSSAHLPPVEEKMEYKNEVQLSIIEVPSTDEELVKQDVTDGKSLQFFPKAQGPREDKEFKEVQCLQLEF